MKNVFIYTFGCKANQYDSQLIIERLPKDTYQITDEAEKANIIVINTCTVTHKADAKSKDLIVKARRENPKAKIVVCGCLSQVNHDFINSLGVDYNIPQDDKQYVADIISGNKIKKKTIWDLKINRFYNHRAFIKIQDGCDNFCSFCKIPGSSN